MAGPHAVRIAAGAEADLHAIWRRRLAQRGASGQDGADALLDDLVARIESLGDYPSKGPVPPELEALGIYQYRQIARPPFRIIYHPSGEPGTITVLIIADARRDFRKLLEERLLAGGE